MPDHDCGCSVLSDAFCCIMLWCSPHCYRPTPIGHSKREIRLHRRVCLQVLTDHTDEVWHVAFSHDGTMMASASKDHTAIIYQVQQQQHVTKRSVLSGHSASIAYLAWSPDDTMLATCGNDNVLRVWSSKTGECLKEMSHHSKEVSAVAWLPDSK